MGYIKTVKDTLGNAVEQGKDLIKGGAGQVLDIFKDRETFLKYRSDIQFQTGFGSIKPILQTIDAIYKDPELKEEEKFVLLVESLQKTKSECVKYRSCFYQALVILALAEAKNDRDQYLIAIEGFSQAIGEGFSEKENTPDAQGVAAKWGQAILRILGELGREIEMELHSATGGLLGSDAEDPQKELSKSFKETPALIIDQFNLNEHNCNSFCQYKIATCYEKRNQIDEARSWYIRSSSSKSPVIKQKSKDGYDRVNPLYIQSFGKKNPEARANVIFYSNLDSMAGKYDPSQVIIPFEMNGLPDGLTFSTNRPKVGVLYQLHPCRDYHYVEYENYDKVIFDEQISDFLRLCQGVGADYIEFADKEHKEIKDDELLKFASELNIYTGEDNAGAKFGFSRRNSRLIRSTSDTRKVLKLGHIRHLSVPEDLVWAGKEGWTDGNNLIKSFRSGEPIVGFDANFKTSSYQKSRLSSDADLKASYEKMAPSVSGEMETALTTSGEINQSEGKTFSQKETKHWILHVHFSKRGFAGFIERIRKMFAGE